MTGESGVVTSPGFGASHYPDMMTCTWRILPASGKSVQLRFEAFSLEEDKDYLKVISCGVFVYNNRVLHLLKYFNVVFSRVYLHEDIAFV